MLKSEDYRIHIDSQAVGTAIMNLSRDRVLSYRFQLPPPQEQISIAAVLGSLDDKIEQSRKTARALERLAQAIFRAWFVDFEPVKAKAAGAGSFPSMPQEVFDALPTRLVESEVGNRARDPEIIGDNDQLSSTPSSIPSSGLLSPPTDLDVVIRAWSCLPAPLRAGIVALVTAAAVDP